jgi:hypothetical protein
MSLKNAAEDGVPDGKVALLQPLALR